MAVITSFENALNSLVQDNLGLIELSLDFHDAVGGLRVLILGQIFFERWEVEGLVAVCPCGPGSE